MSNIISMKSRLLTIIWSMIAAFATYSCMYAYRKPLSAGTFEEYTLAGIDYKVILVVMQVLGYLTAKFIGIKVISELNQRNRAWMLLSLIGISQLALLFFALTPFPYNFIWIFFNGLPLGFIWGIVFTYIEGRRATDVLATFLSISFIVSSGFVKSIGRYLIEDWQIPEFWMPFSVGCIFIPFVLISAWMLEQIPAPSEDDKNSRSPRVPLDKHQRKQLFSAYAFGLSAILFVNMVLTVGRDIKDNFLVEIFRSIGMDTSTGIYTQTETTIGLFVLGLLSLMVLIQKNKQAFYLIHLIMLLGLVTMLLATFLLSIGALSPFVCIVLHGIGLYTTYIVFQSLYFERFIASFRIKGNVGYLIYLSDFIGYLASCIILIGKEFIGFSANWKYFFINMSYCVGILGIITIILAFWYFSKKLNHEYE